eukprot:3104497-Prymnesium_polylepis.3
MPEGLAATRAASPFAVIDSRLGLVSWCDRSTGLMSWVPVRTILSGTPPGALEIACERSFEALMYISMSGGGEGGGGDVAQVKLLQSYPQTAGTCATKLA